MIPPFKSALWASVILLSTPQLFAVNYEVYPGSAFYLTQMLDRSQWPFVAEFSSGLYHHPVGFQELDDTQEQTYSGHFSNRFAMVEGDMGSGSTTGDVGNIKRMKALGLSPVAAFVNRASSNLAVWRQLVRNNAVEGAPSYEMLAPHRLDDTALGWNDPKWDYARANMGVPGCIGSGVDAPVHLFVNQAPAYRQSIYDMRDWTVSNGSKFNYLISPNNSYDAALLADTQATVRALEDNGHEPDVYGVVLYGERPVDLTPEKVTVNGVDQAATTITGLAYWLIKHRDGEPGSLDLSASRAGTTYAAGQTAPVLLAHSQVVPLSSSASRTFTLRMSNTSPWLDYAGVLRARAYGSAQDWTISFTKSGQNITSSVIHGNGRVFLGADRWMPGSQIEVSLTVAPVGNSPGPLKLVVEALPHEGVDHALDVISFESGTVGNTPPTLALNTVPKITREALPFGPLWFTCGDTETTSPGLTVTAVSSNTTLVPNANITLGQSGIQRWIRVVPAVGQWGSTQISVTASDGTASVTKSFTLEVARTTILPVVKANNLLPLDTGGSWTSSIVPGVVDQAVWDGTVTAAQALTLGSDCSFGGLRLTNPGGDITIGGEALLALGLAGVDLGTSSKDLYLNGPVQLDDSSIWTVAAGRLIRVTQGISGLAGLSKSGNGKLELLGDDAFAGPLVVSAGECLKTGSGNQSSTTVSANGILRISGAGGFGAGGAAVTAANSSTGRIEISGGISVLGGRTLTLNSRNSNSDAMVSTGDNTLGANISLSTGGSLYAFNSHEGLFTLSGNVSAVASGNRTFTLRGNADGRMTGVISNGSGAVGIIKAGAGKWTLAGTHSFTGSVTHQAGTLELASDLPAQDLSVAESALLIGSGSMGGSVSIAGIHSAGLGVGTQQVSGSLVYQATARLRVEFAGQSSVADLIQAAGVSVNPGAKVELVCHSPGSSVSFSDPFWKQPQSWTILTNHSRSGAFSLASDVPKDSFGHPATPFGVFNLVHAASGVLLEWVPAPPFQVWQYENFAELWDNETVAGPARDPDADGWTNLDEWIVGTLPTVATSRFVATFAAGNLSFDRLADRIYRVETSESLAGDWTLHALAPAGAGTVSIPCPSHPGNTRFYRVSISRVP
jgi:autotransporter-associated beta strand protein